MSKLRLRKAANSNQSSEDLKNDKLSNGISDGCKEKLFSDVKLVEFSTERKEIHSKLKNNTETTSKYFNADEKDSSMNDSNDFSTKKNVKKASPNDINNLVKHKPSKINDRKRKTKPRTKKASKNGDLRKYTDEFQKICNNGGVDVDPDHLQLAIALSQSLVDYQKNSSQNENNDDISISGKKKSTESNNTANLRKTLEQFGFKVNSKHENVVKGDRKSFKYKRRDNYSLINKTHDQKAEIISNKIAEILFENVKRVISVQEINYEIVSKSLKELCCLKNSCYEKLCMPYEDMNDELYYVPNLIVPSNSKIGSLLKDWSTIPGREKSPERPPIDENLIEDIKFKCNLDVLLSEPLMKVKNTMNSNIKTPENESLLQKNCISDEKNESEDNACRIRCYSPDLFNDESFNTSCGVMENHTISQPILENDIINVLTSSDDDNDDLPDVYISQSKLIPEVIEINTDVVEENTQNTKKNILTLDENDEVEMCDIDLNDSSKNTRQKSLMLDVSDDEAEMCDNVESKNTKQNSLILNESNDDVEMCEDGNGIMHFESYCDLSFNKSSNSLNEINKQTDSIDLDSSSSSTIFNNDEKNDTQQSIHSEVKSNEKLVNSQEDSDIFVISDDEFNYSMIKPKNDKQFKPLYEEIFDDDPKNESMESIKANDFKDESNAIDNVKESVTENENYYNFTKMYRSSILNTIHTNNSIETSQNHDFTNNTLIKDVKVSCVNVTCDSLPDIHLSEQKIQSADSMCVVGRNIFCTNTPILDKYIVKTGNVTPLTDYNNYETPDIIKALSKYGLKPLKRKRAVKILEHIYEQTHPLVDMRMLENERKKSKLDNVIITPQNDHSFYDDIKDNSLNLTSVSNERSDGKDVVVEQCNIYSPNIQDFDFKLINCSPDDWIFQTREKSKILGCRVPLHIVFHNYLCRRTKLRESILRYEPLDIEIIFKDFAANGFKYKPKDLMSFLDKKCIAIKTVNKPTRVKGGRRKVK